MISGTFFENVDLAKICVSPRREPHFSGSESLKIKAKSLYKSHRKNNEKDIEVCLDFHSILASPGRSGASLGCFLRVLN